MTPDKIRAKIVRERLVWIANMIQQIRALPLETPEAFLHTPHAAAAAESYVRRALEGLFDLGRHILAKGFRLTHFYSDVTPEDLYRICTEHLDDIERITNRLETWLREHPASLDDQF